MEKTISNIIGGIMAGLLGLLWTDLRNIRKEREKLVDLIRASEDSAKVLAMKVSSEVDAKYLDRGTHALLCQNVVLTMEKTFGKMLKEAVDELKQEIRKGNGNAQRFIAP